MSFNKKKQDVIAGVAHDAAMGLLQSIPVGGMLVGYIFGHLVTHPIEERKQAWMNSVSEKLSELEANQIGLIERLSQNPEFLDVLYQASNIALKNSKEEKLNALRNAVLNAATAEDVDYSMKMMFLHIIDQLTPLHLQILYFMDDPIGHFEKHGLSSNSSVVHDMTYYINMAYPEYKNNYKMLSYLLRDLKNHDLQYYEMGYRSQLNRLVHPFRPYTTDFGKKFLAFITKQQPL